MFGIHRSAFLQNMILYRKMAVQEHFYRWFYSRSTKIVIAYHRNTLAIIISFNFQNACFFAICDNANARDRNVLIAMKPTE